MAKLIYKTTGCQHLVCMFNFYVKGNFFICTVLIYINYIWVIAGVSSFRGDQTDFIDALNHWLNLGRGLCPYWHTRIYSHLTSINSCKYIFFYPRQLNSFANSLYNVNHDFFVQDFEIFFLNFDYSFLYTFALGISNCVSVGRFKIEMLLSTEGVQLRAPIKSWLIFLPTR